MTDYTDLIARLRGLAEYIDDCDEAADALEAQAKRIVFLEALISETNTYYAKCIATREEFRARIAELEAALKDCADDLEAELDARYRICPDNTVHPAMQRKYEMDLLTVRAARAALEKKND